MVDHPVLIDVTPLQSEHRVRGVGGYVRQLITAIEALGTVRPHYLASTVGAHPDAVVPRERTHFVARPHRPAQVYWLYNELALRRAFRKLQPRAFLATDFNGLISNPYGKTVAVLHDLAPFKLASSEPQGISRTLSDVRWRVYARKLASSEHVIAVSESSKQDAIDLLGLAPSRIEVVHHGVDHVRFHPMAGHGAYAASPPYFLHVGGRNQNKNQELLVAAFARVAQIDPRVEMWFAGPWRNADRAWLAEAGTRYGLPSRVRHLGYVADADLASLYGNALAFVFPSLEEGFGLPVLEAMACGAPVITSNGSSLREVAADAAVLVDPRSEEDVFRAMERLLRNEDDRARLRARGLVRAAAFTWRRTAEATLDALLGPAT